MTPRFTITIEDRAQTDIQRAFEYYEGELEGLGLRFNLSVFRAIDSLRINPFYQVKYDSFRCFPIKKFPFMIHFEVDELVKEVIIYAIIHTHRNPNENWLMKKNKPT